MEEMKRYLRATYSDSCQLDIMTETSATFSNPEMPTIIPYTGTKRSRTYLEINYFKKKIIDKAIHQKLRKKHVYKTDMQKIYNLIVG